MYILRNEYIRAFLGIILRIISRFIPKKNRVCICANTMTHGNSFYVKEVFKGKDIEIKLLTDNHEEGTIKTESFKGFWTLIRSKVMLSSHFIPNLKIGNQTHIHYWHGQHLKSIGNSNTSSAKEFVDYSKLIDFQMSTSRMTSLTYAFSWNLKPHQFLYFGEPVFEYLNDPYRFLNKEEKAYVQSIPEKTILYAPTYRRSKYSEDGSSIDQVLEEFLKFSQKHTNHQIIISLHPFEKVDEQIVEIFNQLDHVSFSLIHTEKLLPFVDLVILDLSSLFHQSLYLRKKVLIFFPDVESYKNTRGLFYENLEIYPKSIICQNAEELSIKLSMEFSSELNFLRNLFFTVEMDRPCEKLYSFVEKLIA